MRDLPIPLKLINIVALKSNNCVRVVYYFARWGYDSISHFSYSIRPHHLLFITHFMNMSFVFILVRAILLLETLEICIRNKSYSVGVLFHKRQLLSCGYFLLYYLNTGLFPQEKDIFALRNIKNNVFWFLFFKIVLTFSFFSFFFTSGGYIVTYIHRSPQFLCLLWRIFWGCDSAQRAAA